MYKPVIISLILGLTSGLSAHGQSAGKAEESIGRVLRSIEANNKELQAQSRMAQAEKWEAKAENNLPDPTVSYAHLWGSKDRSETIGELIVSQSFDFPTVYASRGKLNRLRADAVDSRTDLFRQEILLKAQLICLDIICLRQQQRYLDERSKHAQILSELYDKRMQMGDANILEINKIRLEVLNVQTETRLNKAELNNRLSALATLNGGLPVDFDAESFPGTPLPADLESLKAEVLATDRGMTVMHKENASARQLLSLRHRQWLPKLELGYRRNTESGLAFNGVVVGFSIPIFENRKLVRAARTRVQALELQRGNAERQTLSETEQLYEEARTLHQAIHAYEETFRAANDLELLQRSLISGQISLIAYFADVAVIYQSRMNQLQLTNRYEQAMAQLHKGKL